MNSLQSIINSSGAFAKPINIIQTIPFNKVTLRQENVSHSLYEELWHIEYWMHFSLALIHGENPVMPAHSADSFPSDNDSLSESDWQTLVAGVLGGLDRLVALSQDEPELARKFNQRS